MLKTFQLKLALSAFALGLGSQACTVVEKNPDENTDDLEETEGSDSADAGETEDPGATDTDVDETDTDVTDAESTDTEMTDAETTDPGDAGVPAVDDDGGSPAEMDGGAEPEPEPEPEPGDDEYAALVPAFDCGDRSTADAETVELRPEDDVSWSGTVYVDGEFRLGDAELTIEPGTRVIMGADASIVLGYLNAAASVRANGTPDAPITFCGEQPDVGYWGGITVEENVVGISNMSNVLIDGAGGDAPSLSLEADLLLENLVIRNGGDVGLRAADFSDDSSGLFVTGQDAHAVELTTAAAVMNFPRGGNLTGNGEDLVLLDFTNLNEDATFRNLLVPYSIERPELRIAEGATVVVDAGVEFLMGADTRIVAGYLNSDATLQINGTESHPVVMRGAGEDNGFWEGIEIQPNVRTNSLVEHLELSGAGGNDEATLDIQAAITISHLDVSNSGRGVRISSQGLDQDSTSWSITGSESEPLEIDVNAWPTLPEDSTFVGNADDRVLVDGQSLTADGTILALDVPYLVTEQVRLMDGAEITIEAGAEFIMSSDTRFIVGYLGADATLIADGTEEAPIRFAGLDPVPGYWDGIYVEDDANSSTRFSFVEVGHAGQEIAALVLRVGASVQDCTLFDSAGAGIAKAEENMTDYASDNTFVNNAGDDVIEL